MPWRGPEYEGEMPSLGWELLDWWSDVLPSPRDETQPIVFTDEQAQLIIDWFTIDPLKGQFLYHRGCSRRSKGTGKSPVEAAKAIAEFAGPVRFAGWDASGEPVGRPWGTQGDPPPWVQIAAVSEDQTDNTNSVVQFFLTANQGKASTDLGIDYGFTVSRIKDRPGSKMEPVTASSDTRQGQPVTYAVLDETHLWTPRNGGKKLAKRIRDNVSKMDGRSYETTNSFVPGTQSVAEDTHKAAERGTSGIFYDAVEAPKVTLDDSDEKIAAALRFAYKDRWWVNIDRLVAHVRDPDTSWDDACRYFFNWNQGLVSQPFDIKAWERRADPTRSLTAGERIGLGFDGSISDDRTVLYGCTPDAFVFHLASWQRPPNAGRDWRIPRLEVHQAVRDAFATYDVGRMLCDPPKWYTEIEGWTEEFGEERVIVLDTNQPRRFAPACDRFATSVREGTVSHDGGSLLTASFAACAKKPVRLADDPDDGRSRFVVVKADTRKIDDAVGAILALEAAMTMPAPAEAESESDFIMI